MGAKYVNLYNQNKSNHNYDNVHVLANHTIGKVDSYILFYFIFLNIIVVLEFLMN